MSVEIDERVWRWQGLGETEGQGWPTSALKRTYDRLPAHAESMVPPLVWDLSRSSSGLFARFRTDATAIRARWRIGNDVLSRPHMPSTSVAGLDLYGMDPGGRPRWIGFGAPTGFPDSECDLVVDLDGVERDYLVYFPVFNELERLEIGVPPEASFKIIPTNPLPPVVYYGTSIIHGIAASRSGMTLPAILGRRLDRTVIGLGFSGNGKMEVELAQLIAEIDAAAYVIDCLPNMDSDLVSERTVPFIEALREHRPDVPVLLVEDRTFGNAWARPALAERHRLNREAYRAAYQQLSAGDPNLHYLAADQLLGDDDEGTVDGSHPTDLGFTRMADVIEPRLRALLS